MFEIMFHVSSKLFSCQGAQRTLENKMFEIMFHVSSKLFSCQGAQRTLVSNNTFELLLKIYIF